MMMMISSPMSEIDVAAAAAATAAAAKASGPPAASAAAGALAGGTSDGKGSKDSTLKQVWSWMGTIMLALLLCFRICDWG